MPNTITRATLKRTRATTPAPRRSGRRGRQGEALTALLLLTPAGLALVLLRVYPMIYALVESFHKEGLDVFQAPQWAGFANYSFLLFHSVTFWPSVGSTVLFVAIVVIVQTVLSLALAVLLTQRMFRPGLWRTLIFLPVTIPMAISTLVWQIALRNDGIVNAFLSAVGLSQHNYFATRGITYFSFVIILSWIGLGFWMIILIAGLNDIPRELREAAAIDGAGRTRTFFSVILPQLKRPLAFIAVALTITNFFTFVPEEVITAGGPNNSTDFLMYDIYQQAYQNGNLNLASAELVLFTIIILVIIGLEFRFISPRER
jgi:multiple sugar transport system permease protein